MTQDALSARLGSVPAPQVPSHPDVATWRPATAADIDAIHTLMGAADPVDHPTWTTPREDIADLFDLAEMDPARDMLLAEDADGTLLAYGEVLLHPSREGGELTVYLSGTVHPAHRRRGIGARLLAWQHARGLERLAEGAAHLEDGGVSGEMKIYAEERNAGQRALAEAAGYQVERWFTSMVRDLADAPGIPTVPDGLEVVAYTHDRDLDALEARNDAFRDHWGSRPTEPQRWMQFVGGEFFRADLSRLVLDGGRIVAFCLASVNEDDWETLGASNSYIDLIGVVRSHRRRGLAPLVIANTLDAIRAAGLQKAVLDVDTASPTGANALYEGLGFAATERSIALVMHV
ncbi:GNAT family N-acetyltransferase [Microbacterium sp. bgisy189]|uniref:GNAT family N-acetyltransferase n=1 Tax=Microbacterium sp. bgisy189 TaxID=3413798 RepID=UPI003EBF1AD4